MEFLIIVLIVFSLVFIVMLLDKSRKKLSWKDYLEKSAQESKERTCSHEKWNCDISIRRIECCECGKRAWIEDYKDLYTNKKD